MGGVEAYLWCLARRRWLVKEGAAKEELVCSDEFLGGCEVLGADLNAFR